MFNANASFKFLYSSMSTYIFKIYFFFSKRQSYLKSNCMAVENVTFFSPTKGNFHNKCINTIIPFVNKCLFT